MSRIRDRHLLTLADLLGLGLVETRAGRIVAANRGFCDLVGRAEAELIALPSAVALFSPEARSLLGTLYDRGRSGPTNACHDLTLVDGGGNTVPVSVAFALTPGPHDAVDATALVRDRRAEYATAQDLERFSVLVDRLPAGILVWDGRGVKDAMEMRLLLANQAALDLLGRPRDVLVGATIGQAFPAVDPGEAARLLGLCGTDRVEHFGEVAYGGERAGHRLYRWHALALPGGVVAAIFDDITAERAGEVRRHDLLRRLLDASDEQRRRLSMDLHDDAIQQIAAAAILVEGLQRHPESPHLPERLSSAEQALRAALGSLRRLVFELSPPELVESGLEAAVTSAADYLFTDTATTVVVAVDGADDMPTTVQTTAFRIVAEALTNVFKHARASEVRVAVSVRDDDLTIDVVDDGIGLQQTGGPGHIGLRNMQERAAALGGICTISPRGPPRNDRSSVAPPCRPEHGRVNPVAPDIDRRRRSSGGSATAAGQPRCRRR